MFLQGCMQSNHQLALSRLMHSIHCSMVCPYQALERIPAQENLKSYSAQETLMGCAGLHDINSQALNIALYSFIWGTTKF
jgi:hypothetical protein